MNELRVFFCIPKSMYEEIKSIDESTPTLDAIVKEMVANLDEKWKMFTSISRSEYKKLQREIVDSNIRNNAIERYMFTLKERLEGFGADVGRM